MNLLQLWDLLWEINTSHVTTIKYIFGINGEILNEKSLYELSPF